MGLIRCRFQKPCFAKTKDDKCTALNATDANWKECPFWKVPDGTVLSIEDRNKEIYKMRMIEKIPASEIAEIFGLTENYVFDIVRQQKKKNLVNPYRPGDLRCVKANELERIRELINQNIPIPSIAERMKISSTTLYSWRKKGLI